MDDRYIGFADRGFGFAQGLGHIGSLIVGALFTLLVVAVIVGLVVLLVRYLLVATKAAQLYIDKNSPVVTSTPTTATPTTPVTPVTKPRTPKTPPPAV